MRSEVQLLDGPWISLVTLPAATVGRVSCFCYIESVIRVTRIPLIRYLSALAIAIASPGMELSHGLAHDHDHDAGAHHAPVAHSGHDSEAAFETAPSEHPHQRVSDALRVRGDALDYLPLPARLPDFPAVVVAQLHSAPISEPRFFGDRATGPPPRLRDPPHE